MRKLTTYNYEEFFLDYLEERLSIEEKKMLENFLIDYPELKAELDDMSLAILEKEDCIIDKGKLKEIPFRSSFDEFCIAELEGDLTVEEQNQLYDFVKRNQSYHADFELYKHTKIYADVNVQFPDEKKLKKKEKKRIPLLTLGWLGAAASVLLLFFLANDLFFSNQAVTNETKIADLPNKSNSAVQKINVVSLPLTDEKEKLPQRKTAKTRETLIAMTKQRIQPITKIENQKNQFVYEKVALPEIVAERKEEALTNTQIAQTTISVVSNKKTSIKETQNSGLTQLGLSWKSSIPEKKNSVVYAIAKYGVNKLGEIAGKKVQLEKKYDSTTEKTKLNFNTTGLGFSTSVK